MIDIPKSATYKTIAEMDLSCSWSDWLASFTPVFKKIWSELTGYAFYMSGTRESQEM